VAEGPKLSGLRLEPLRADQIVSGSTYHGLECRECEKPIAIAPVDGTRPASSGSGGHFRVVCPHCNEERLYAEETLLPFPL
jgi:hypothetical protein